MESGNTAPENFELNDNVVQRAYLYLKNYAYYDNLNFFLKLKIAEFECDSFDAKIKNLSFLLNDENFATNSVFKDWLESIDYYVLPKSISKHKDEGGNSNQDGLVIRNVTSLPIYDVRNINFFISATVELHIIEFLWCLVIGPILEEDLSESCYGNRLDDSAAEFIHQNNPGNFRSLFKYYVRQYGSWRDQALSVATEIHKNNENVALLSLDLKSYFYNVDLDFSKIADKIKTAFEDNDQVRGIALKLNDFLRLILATYHGKIAENLETTRPECKGKLGLPIGFASSSVLGNWYLAEFDKNIIEKARPDYYGRYVDDVIMVFKNPGTGDGDKLTVKSFVSSFLGEHLIKGDDKDTTPCFYIEVGNNRLPVQQDKLIFYLLDKEHSRAVLEVFREELQERSSAFRFLPGDEIEGKLDRFAYDILYDGSHNKLRSITGMRENTTELASYLARHIILRRLCKVDRKDSVLSQLTLFFKGKNALEFSRLWEKVYQYAVVVQDDKFIQSFYKYLNSEIDKTRFLPESMDSRDESLSNKLRQDLRLYNRISLGLSVGLLDMDLFKPEQGISVRKKRSEGLHAFLLGEKNIGGLAVAFRGANLIRHHLVAWPMANFTGFRGDLTDEQEFRKGHMNLLDLDLKKEKFERSPRFIHFEEWQLFYLQRLLADSEERSPYEWQKEFRERCEEYFSNMNLMRSGEEHISCRLHSRVRVKKAHLEKDDSIEKIQTYSIAVGKQPVSPPKKIRIALANVKIKESDIENAIRKDKNPNTSFERQKELYEIMNSAVRERADVLVMPELSTPVSWLPFMAAHCRKHQLAMIFGLEHWEVRDHVYNLLVELLPFKVSEKYRSCYMTARIKNHYAPEELKLMDTLRLKPPHSFDDQKSYYNKVNWRGINFASYNCFELSDIEHRALFKSEIDVLFACVCNKDTNYYQSILESAVRDMHCYVVQSNASQYGGTCVLKPAKTEEKTMLYVKGGENPSILITEIDVAALRNFQYKPSSGSKESFKPLPPGFDSEKVLER